MIGWQECCVVIVLLLCVWWIGRRLSFVFRQIAKKKNPCCGCTVTDCVLKKQLLENEHTCPELKKKERKSCCR